MPGFPIRTPWDHSLVDSSPRPIAASHVLHRLLVPRHPPFALDNLTTKMLASTVQFSTNNQPTTPQPHTKDPAFRRRYARPGHAWRLDELPLVFKALKDNQLGLFFQDPTGCLRSSPAAPGTRSHHRSGCTRGLPAVAGAELASVSAI